MMSDSPRSATLKNDWPIHKTGYQLLKAIGKGYFGIVWEGEVLEGRHKGKHVAIKKYDLEKCGNTKIEEIRKNILLLNLLDHPNILSYKASFTSSNELWVVTELMDGGSIDKIMQFNFKDGLKDQTLIATILKEALQGIKYLHQNNQIHRDIKSANILVSLDGSIKISDFGLSAKLKEGKKRNTFIGSPCWMAPEVLEQDSKNGYDSKADIWSFGITALELAYGKPPNSELNTMKLILKTINEEPPVLEEGDCWDESFRTFVSNCLVKDPRKRKSADELLKSSKGFLYKAKGKEYIKEKLLKGLGPLESRVDPQTIEMAKAQISGCCIPKSKTLDFSFHIDDGEGEEQSQSPIDTTKIQIMKAHLPRLESELLIGRNLSTAHSSRSEPHSANIIRKSETPTNKPSKYFYRQSSQKVGLCKGDVAQDLGLPEEES